MLIESRSGTALLVTGLLLATGCAPSSPSGPPPDHVLADVTVIASATSVGAAVIGVEDELGSVEVGKVADLVLYRDDPSQDVTALRTPARVIHGGWVVGS